MITILMVLPKEWSITRTCSGWKTKKLVPENGILSTNVTSGKLMPFARVLCVWLNQLVDVRDKTQCFC